MRMLPLILPVLCAGVNTSRFDADLDLMRNFDGALRGRYARSKRHRMIEHLAETMI